ncbi:hypothetical protein [Kitasatospora cathayae]|uniref:PknH-like extracellular domain-containing protein n=1 Tax=Kitasatospora cathayae TaxID=3004092 RepID=A0ABY7Q4V9_9ACTN|nr:hypothetical protein [Kitasatospora sp. HUAS 3-15]WBP87750.1 hypothetical protein O1G21_19125 [Kitasatospora sp. HUAS 3-15]
MHHLRPAAPPAGTVRRTRHLYTTALPLIGLAAGVVGYFALDHTLLTGDRTVRPAITAAGSPTPSATFPTPAPATATSSPTPSAPTPSETTSAAPTGTHSTTPSALASSSPATDASATGSPAGANATSGQYIAATWLKAPELPLNSAFHWQGAAGTPTNTTGDFQWLWVCGTGSPTTELQTTSISTLNFSAAGSGASTVRAAQLMFYFRTADAADKALNRIQQNYAGCAADKAAHGPTDMTTGAKVSWQITRTANSTAGFAYSSVAREAGGKPANMPDLPSDSQEWFARSGNVITMVSVSGPDAEIDPTGDAARTLETMTTRLGNFPR